MTYPMLVDVTPEAVYNKVMEKLFALTESRMDGHIGGGLVGVPIITKWAIEKLDWELDGNRLDMDVYIPCGVTATVLAPADAAGCRIQGKTAALKSSRSLGSGNYRISFDLN